MFLLVIKVAYFFFFFFFQAEDGIRDWSVTGVQTCALQICFLKPRMLSGEALAAERARARTLRTVRVSSRERGDLIMLGIGGFTPLEGFMTRADCEGVCKDYRTAAGLFWPNPITLSVDATTAASIRLSDTVAVTAPATDAPLATIRFTETYSTANP